MTIPVVTQPCFDPRYAPIGGIIAKGEPGHTHTLDSIRAALQAAALPGTNAIFNMKVKTVSYFGECHEATADCFKWVGE